MPRSEVKEKGLRAWPPAPAEAWDEAVVPPAEERLEERIERARFLGEAGVWLV